MIAMSINKNYQRLKREAKNRGILVFQHLKSYNNNDEEFKHSSGEYLMPEGLAIFESI